MPDDVVVVMTDDHGQWCSEPYGNPDVETPTLEHLARTGVRMDNAFCPTPVCSPARASFFTGLRASQHGIHDWIEIGSEHDGPGWLADETTLPELLGEAGYRTALAGKWHCGRGGDAAAFDRTANTHAEGWDVPKFSLERDRRIVDRALSMLREERERDAPLFLFVGLTATHGPWSGGPERLVERHRGVDACVPEEPTYRFGRRFIDWIDDEDEALAQYYAAVEGIDEQVGRIVDDLEAAGALVETLVAYTADHGHSCGHHGIWGKGNGTRPQNALEESIRVPLLVGGHADLPDGQVRPEFVDHCDTFRTLLEFAGVDPPTDRDYPGESYLPQLHGAGSTDREQVQICEYADVRAIRTERHKLVRQLPDGPDLLFDLDADPRETRNVADDPGYEAVRERLGARLEEAFERYADPGAEGVPVAELPRYNSSEAWER